MIEVEELHTADDLARLAPEWQALADRSGAAVCCHPWWVRPWLEHHGGGRPMILCARDGGELSAVLALHERRLGPIRLLRGVGHGLGGVPQVVQEGGTSAGAEAIWQALSNRSRTAIDLRNLRMDAALAQMAETLGSAMATGETNRCPVLPVPDDIEAHLMSRSKRLRKNLRRGRRRLDERGQVFEMEAVTTGDRLQQVLPEVLAVYDAAEAANPRQHLLRDRWAGFTRAVLDAAASTGRLRLFLGRVEGRAATFDIGLAGEDRLELWLGRFDPVHADLSPGHLALETIARDPFVRDIGTIDLGLGDDSYKHLWTDDGHPTVDVVLAPSPMQRRVASIGLSALERRANADVQPD